MVKDVGLKATLSLSQKRCSGLMLTGFRRGFSMIMTLVTVSLTGDASSKVPRTSGALEVIV